MVIIMKDSATQNDIDYVVRRASSLGLRSHISKDNGHIVIGLLGNLRAISPNALAGLRGVDRIVSMIALFTPADIEYLFQKVRQVAFEGEFVKGEDYRVTTETFLEMIPKVPPTLTHEIIQEFQQDYAHYTRY